MCFKVFSVFLLLPLFVIPSEVIQRFLNDMVDESLLTWGDVAECTFNPFKLVGKKEEKSFAKILKYKILEAEVEGLSKIVRLTDVQMSTMTSDPTHGNKSYEISSQLGFNNVRVNALAEVTPVLLSSTNVNIQGTVERFSINLRAEIIPSTYLIFVKELSLGEMTDVQLAMKSSQGGVLGTSVAFILDQAKSWIVSKVNKKFPEKLEKMRDKINMKLANYTRVAHTKRRRCRM